MKHKHSHWSSLSECPKCGESHGPAWAGRKWWSVYPETDANGNGSGRPKEKRIEWNLFTRRNNTLRFGLNLWGGDGNDEILFHIAIPFLCSIWFALEGYIADRYSKTKQYDTERCWSLEWCFNREVCGDFGTIRLEIARNTMSWSRDDPWWHNIHCDVAERLLGEFKYNRDKLDSYEMKAQFPEAVYDVVLTEEWATWQRPRFFGMQMHHSKLFWKEWRGFDIRCDKGVPIPGKGENSWDQGDGAIFGTGSSKDNPQDALNDFICRTMERRRKYGGMEAKYMGNLTAL